MRPFGVRNFGQIEGDGVSHFIALFLIWLLVKYIVSKIFFTFYNAV